MVKKIFAGLLATGGLFLLGWGAYIFVMSVYFLATKNQIMGPGAGLGYFYGGASIIIGLALLSVGGLLLFSKEKFSTRQDIIIVATFVLTFIFLGLSSKVIILKEDDKTCQTYYAATFYGRPIGGEIATYDKMSQKDYYTPRRKIVSSKKGLAELRFASRYTLWLIIITLLGGTALFFMNKKK
jgi:hypothetical protein